MAVYAYLGLCTAVYAYVGLCIAVYGYVGAKGYVWLCRAT